MNHHDCDDDDDFEDLSEEEMARLEGATRGDEFRYKEIEYDRRGGRHECTVARICCFRYMLAQAQYESLARLQAPAVIVSSARRRVERIEQYVTPGVRELIASNWEPFMVDYRRDGLAAIIGQGWAKRFSVVPHPHHH